MAKKAQKSKKSQNRSSSGSSASANKSIERVSARGMVLKIKTGEGTRRSSRQLSSVAGEKEKRPNLAIKGRTQKKNKKKGKSDAKMPKKPPTAFFFFLEDFRKEFQEQNPDVKSMRDIGKACGEKWKIMTYEEKVKYYDIATEKRAEFDRSMAEYIKRKESGEDNESESDSEFDE